MKKHRKTVLAAIMLILVVASAVFAARVHTVSLDAENVAKITAKSTVTQAPPDEIVLTDSQGKQPPDGMPPSATLPFPSGTGDQIWRSPAGY